VRRAATRAGASAPPASRKWRRFITSLLSRPATATLNPAAPSKVIPPPAQYTFFRPQLTRARAHAYGPVMRETVIDVGGEKLRFFEAGTGAPVLYLHGAGGANWYPLLEMLSARWRVIAPEHPGFGRSAIPEWMAGVSDLAFFYLDAMAALGLEDVHLLGHSLGGWTAAEIAIRNTARLKSVTLMAPAGIASREEPFGDIFLWSDEEHARNSFVEPALIAARLASLAGADVDIQLQNRAAAARLAWSPRLHNPQLPYWLHRIDVPTLLVWGIEDRICPFSCHLPYLKGIAGAQLFALPRSGHALHTERPAEVAARLDTFFAGA
jgi:pimeloyl-ACP methyl ester carboxylesterase